MVASHDGSTSQSTSFLDSTRFALLKQRFGEDKVAILTDLFQQGDPLADAVIQVFDGIGAASSRDLNRGIIEGAQAVSDAPSALHEFLAETEHRPAWVEPERLRRGAEAYLTIGNLWITLSLSTGSLIHTYSSASIARVLVKTGNLTKMAQRRLIETGAWLMTSVLPNAMERGAPGYVHNLQVRLLHARVRTGLQKRGWDVGTQGMPISQIEMARTWLDFTYVPFTAVEKFGITFSPAEIADLYHFWQYLAYLLGIDARLYRDITDNTKAQAWLELIDSAMEPANADSIALTEAMLKTLASLLHTILRLPESFTFDLASAITRRLHGDALADQLGVKRTWVSRLMPLLVAQNRLQRARLQRDPIARRNAIDYTIEEFQSRLATITDATVYQQNADHPTQQPLPRVTTRGEPQQN